MKTWFVKDRSGAEHSVQARSRDEAHTAGIARYGWITSTRPAQLHLVGASA